MMSCCTPSPANWERWEARWCSTFVHTRSHPHPHPHLRFRFLHLRLRHHLLPRLHFHRWHFRPHQFRHRCPLFRFLHQSHYRPLHRCHLEFFRDCHEFLFCLLQRSHRLGRHRRSPRRRLSPPPLSRRPRTQLAAALAPRRSPRRPPSRARPSSRRSRAWRWTSACRWSPSPLAARRASCRRSRRRWRAAARSAR